MIVDRLQKQSVVDICYTASGVKLIPHWHIPTQGLSCNMVDVCIVCSLTHDPRMDLRHNPQDGVL